MLLQILKVYCRFKMRSQRVAILNPIESQKKVLKNLLRVGAKTEFGKDKLFSRIKNYEDYKNAVSIQTYEDIKPYIEKILKGNKNVLWTGKPIYLSQSSGTTSPLKYIPITKDSFLNHQFEPFTFIDNYLTKYWSILNKGKILFLSESQIFENSSGIKISPISAIKSYHIPKFFNDKLIPSEQTRKIIDFDTKIKKVVIESLGKDIVLIVGMPLTLLLYFRELKKITGKSYSENFPNFSHICSTGMSYEPYYNQLKTFVGNEFEITDSYTASEGFFAYQDKLNEKGMQLLLNQGIFYEFVPVEQLDKLKPERFSIADVKLGINYALIISSNGGLWSYLIGDTVRFVSIFPHKIIITGRTKQFISIFREQLVVEDADNAISFVSKKFNVGIIEYFVAPFLTDDGRLPFHEWFIEFENLPNEVEIKKIELDLESKIKECNSGYAYLLILQSINPLSIVPIKKNGFSDFMKELGLVGEQKKFPRLSNNRELANRISKYKLNRD